MPVETRPATTTYMGDTGLWFVPTGEVLPARRWSFSAYRVNFDYTQGFTDVSNWPMTFGVGLGDRAEIFGAWTSCAASTATSRPIFLPGRRRGRASPTSIRSCRQGWSDNQLGDLWVGGKVNLHVAVAPAAGRVRAPRAGQAADRERRRRRRRHRQAGLRDRRDRQQGNQPARRALRLSAASSSAASPIRWRSVERHPLGLRRRAFRRGAAFG